MTLHLAIVLVTYAACVTWFGASAIHVFWLPAAVLIAMTEGLRGVVLPEEK